MGTPNSSPNSARGILRRNGTGHPEWVRCHSPRAGAASHHAYGREELLRCWADSETVAKEQAYTTPLCQTDRRDRGLDSVARDNPADSLMAQDQWCPPYPNSTGPGPVR